MSSDLLLLYSDPHLRDNGSFGPWNIIDSSNGLTKELNNMILGFSFVRYMIDKLSPAGVGMLGDLYQNTEFQSTRVIQGTNIALSMVQSICKDLGIPHWGIPGNHDWFNEEYKISSMSTLKSYFDVLAFDTHYLDFKGERIVLIPATDSGTKAYVELHKAQQQGADLILAHQDFAGCKYESGAPSQSSLMSDWGIPVISGDIHSPQDIGDIHYVGSLVQHKFYKYGMGNVGGILTFDLNTKEIKRYPNTFSKHYVKVSSIKEGLELDPKKSIVQIVCDSTREEIDEIFKDYEFSFMRPIPQRDDCAVEYSEGFSLSNPKSLLRSHVSKENPDSLSLFDKLMDTNEGDNNEN